MLVQYIVSTVHCQYSTLSVQYIVSTVHCQCTTVQCSTAARPAAVGAPAHLPPGSEFPPRSLPPPLIITLSSHYPPSFLPFSLIYPLISYSPPLFPLSSPSSASLPLAASQASLLQPSTQGTIISKLWVKLHVGIDRRLCVWKTHHTYWIQGSVSTSQLQNYSIYQTTCYALLTSRGSQSKRDKLIICQI